VASALDRNRERALMFGTGAQLAPRLDLAAFRQVTANVAEILVVDLTDVVGAEGANLAPRCVPAAATGTATARALSALTPLAVRGPSTLRTGAEALPGRFAPPGSISGRGYSLFVVCHRLIFPLRVCAF
jgi:hypothetical protein